MDYTKTVSATSTQLVGSLPSTVHRGCEWQAAPCHGGGGQLPAGHWAEREEHPSPLWTMWTSTTNQHTLHLMTWWRLIVNNGEDRLPSCVQEMGEDDAQGCHHLPHSPFRSVKRDSCYFLPPPGWPSILGLVHSPARTFPHSAVGHLAYHHHNSTTINITIIMYCTLDLLDLSTLSMVVNFLSKDSLIKS